MSTSISSRTPEGNPIQCPICNVRVRLEFTDKGDAICPACGALIWIFDATETLIRQRLAEQFSVNPSELTDADLEADSLDVVELVMQLEDDLEITIPDSDYERLKSISDFLEYIKERFPPPDDR